MTDRNCADRNDDDSKMVEVKLRDDRTGVEKSISVPAPPQHDAEEPSLGANDIARFALGVRKQCLLGKSAEEARAMFPDFAARFPVLSDKCCDPRFPLAKLEFMLQQLSAMMSASVSKDAATDKVMEDLNKTYVDGVVDDLEKKRIARELEEEAAGSAGVNTRSGGGVDDDDAQRDARRRDALRTRIAEAKNRRTNKA